MSRSGYSDDCENVGLYRGHVASAIRGQRGQDFLKELAVEMDKMPNKVLITDELVNCYGECCAIGVVCKSRGLDTDIIDYNEPHDVGRAIGVAEQLAAEIVFMNDEYAPYHETPENRWIRMRAWVGERITQIAANKPQ